MLVPMTMNMESLVPLNNIFRSPNNHALQSSIDIGQPGANPLNQTPRELLGVPIRGRGDKMLAWRPRLAVFDASPSLLL